MSFPGDRQPNRIMAWLSRCQISLLFQALPQCVLGYWQARTLALGKFLSHEPISGSK